LNWVDALILATIGLALFTGFRRGVILQVFSWGGFLLGIIVGAALTTPIIGLVDPGTPTSKAVLSLSVFLGTAFIVEGIIAYGGYRLTKRIKHDRVRKADALLGAGVAALVTLVLAWMMSGAVKQVPELGASVRDSAIIRGTHALLHSPPDFVATIGNLLSRTGFPEVFESLNPSLAPGVERPPARLARDREVRAAARLTYKIEGHGCDGVVNGSGFPVDGDTVITAAHVVAGTTDTVVRQAQDAGGDSFPARVVFMDTDVDIAVLYVPSMTGGRLRVDGAEAPRGTDGAAIGYPGGGDRTISVARVRGRTEAIGRDIYSRRQVRRDIYVLRASVHQGNSGGPFVDVDGHVRGVVFAASAQNDEESYALAETEIERALRSAGNRTRPVDTGECAL